MERICMICGVTIFPPTFGIILTFFLLISRSRITTNEPDPEPRFYTQISTLGDSIFLHGGKAYSSETLGDFWEFSTSQQKWNRIKLEGPSPRGYHIMASAIGKLFVFGGFSRYITVELLNDLWYYEDLSMTYRSVASKVPEKYKKPPEKFLIDADISEPSVSEAIAALYDDEQMCDMSFELEDGKIVRGNTQKNIN
jgi:hypothetical protein